MRKKYGFLFLAYFFNLPAELQKFLFVRQKTVVYRKTGNFFYLAECQQQGSIGAVLHVLPKFLVFTHVRSVCAVQVSLLSGIFII